MKKFFYHYTLLIPILLIVILYYVIQMIDPKFREYVKNNTAPSETASDSVSIAQQTENKQPTHTITELKKELTYIIQSLPHPFEDSVLQSILESPIEFIQDIQLVYKHSNIAQLILVDKTHPLDATYAPADIVHLQDYDDILVLNKDTLQVSKSIIDDLLTMHAAAQKDAVLLDISSSYRSYSYQENLFNYYTRELGLEEASRQSAKPGTSQHQLGTTIDFGCICPDFAQTKAGLWLSKNAWKYGFSLSYPPNMEHITGYIYESWHYRHIGIAASSFEHKYFNNTGQQYMLELLAKKEALQALISQYL